MMNYPNMYYPPYNNNMAMNQYPNHFIQAMNQNYGNNQQQQQMTTQPPVTISSTSGSKITLVSNKEEATASPVDLINGTPSFFYNKEKNEVYFKQFDVPTGKGVFKTFIEQQTIEEPTIEEKINYQEDFRYLKDGIDGLYRVLAEMQCPVNLNETEVETKSKKRGQ